MDKKADRAVAIVYNREQSASPTVLASGKGATAEKIIEVAREAGVFVKQDPDLLELLAKVPVGDEIPIEMYQAVAELLAFIYQVNGQYEKN